jgi:hypothetical protein
MRFRVPEGFLRRRQISRKKFERGHHPPIQPTLRNIANRINNRCPSFFYTDPKSEHFQNETSVHRKQNHHISNERVSICRDFFFVIFSLGNWGCEEGRRKKRNPKALSPFWIAASRAAFASSCCWSSFMDAMASSLLLPSFPRSPLLSLVRTTDLVDNRQPRGGYGPHNQPQWEPLFSSTSRAVIKFSSKKPRGAESFHQITRLDEIIVPWSMC